MLKIFDNVRHLICRLRFNVNFQTLNWTIIIESCDHFQWILGIQYSRHLIFKKVFKEFYVINSTMNNIISALFVLLVKQNPKSGNLIGPVQNKRLPWQP